MTAIYSPPRFGLFEFEESQISVDSGQVSRWLASWNGPLGLPALDVTLGWYVDSGDRQCVVSTAEVSAHRTVEDRRVFAALTVLGGAQLTVRGRNTEALRDGSLLSELRSDGSGWMGSRVRVDGNDVPAQVTPVFEAMCGYVELDSRLIGFGCVGLAAEELRFRSMTNTEQYGVNPLVSLSTDELTNQPRPYLPEIDGPNRAPGSA